MKTNKQPYSKDKNPIDGHELSTSESAIINKSLNFLANNGGKIAGEGFLNLLIAHIAESLNVKYSILDKISVDDPTSAETIAIYADNKIIKNIVYPLEGTPCENVFNRSICCYSENVQNDFPKDEVLADWSVESYAGVPLWDSNGTAIGLLAVLDTVPFQNPNFIKLFLQIVAVRAGAELEKMKIHEQLQRERQVYKETFNSAGIAVAFVGIDHKFQKVNAQFENLLGYSQAELQQKTFLDITHPDELDVETVSSRILNEKSVKVLNLEKRYIHADGSVIFCDLTGTRTNNFDGKGSLALVYLKDISERKEAEKNYPTKKLKPKLPTEPKPDS